MTQPPSPPQKEIKVTRVGATQQLSELQKRADSKSKFRKINQIVVEHPDVLQHFHCSIINEISSGGFGTVFKAISSTHGEIALKCIPPRDSKSGFRQGDEVRFLRALSHANILRYHDYFFTSNYCLAELHDRPFLIISTELLQETLYNVIEQPLGLSVYRRLLAQIGSALQFLHSHSIVHHDIKAENIMTDKYINWHTDNRHQIRSQLRRCTFKLIDLGLARHYPNGQTLEENYYAGTRQFSAPEKQTRKAYNPFLADTYSFGVVLLRSLLGNTEMNRKTKQVKGKTVNWFNLAHTLLRGRTPVERVILGTLAPEASRLSIAQVIEGTLTTNTNYNRSHH